VDYFYSAAAHRLRGALRPSFALARITDLFDPSTQKYVPFGDPEYKCSPQAKSGELAKAQAYAFVLKTALKALNREIRQVRLRDNSVQDYIKRLNDYEQQFFQVVPILKEIA
jgi:hypothetical protein